MKSKIWELSFLSILAFCLQVFPAAGESAVITLTLPWGARTDGMGEVGTSLADDDGAAFWNPAGLGMKNERWRRGCASIFCEPYLPYFGLKDLWHASFAACYQPVWKTPGLDLGGFSIFVNHLNLGMVEWADDLGRTIGRGKAFERITGISWGMPVIDNESTPVFIGASFKFVNSSLDLGYGSDGEGAARTFAVDVGALINTPIGFRAGLTIMNMGPSVFYISRDKSEPLPFTINLAIGYKREFVIASRRAIQIACEYRLNRNLADTLASGSAAPFYRAFFTDWNQSPQLNRRALVHNTGIDLKIMNTGSLRCGWVLDPVESDQELRWDRNAFRWGLGVSLFNHFSFDFYRTVSSSSSFFPDEGWGYSFTIFRIGLWQPEDFHWWRAPRLSE
jgi:hypothetical protein